MPSIYDLKPKFQALLRPAVKRLAERGVTANQVTVAACGISVAEGACIASFSAHAWPFLLLPLALFLRMAMNAVDGMLAREHNQKSKLGALLNELGDVVSDVALYLPFALVSGIPAWLIIAIALLAVLTEMTGVLAVQIGASRRYDGPMGKSDRAFCFGVIALVPAFARGWTGYAVLALYAMLALLALTVWNRAKRALKEAAHE